MKPTMICRITVDFFMTVTLLLLMAYELIGTLPHELLGTGMFLLFLLHHILNRSWIRNLPKGRYPLRRIVQTALALLILLTMLGSMASGIVLSKHLFAALPIQGGRSTARVAHMLCGYWGFILMSLHLGLHWGMALDTVRRMRNGKTLQGHAVWLLRGIAGLIAICGLWRFSYHNIGSYLFLRTQFVFFDFDRPVMLFLLDYMAIMGLFVFCFYYAGRVGRQKALYKNKF